MRMWLPVLTFVLSSGAAFAQPAGWVDPVPPFKIADNFYYVGTKELATYLITTPQGNILMNSNYEASVPLIKESVEKLGFKFSETKILIAGHAHPDHVEGDALLKEMTGAKVVVGKLEVERTKEFKPKGKEHPIDQTIDDGETFTFGGWSMTAHTMPGHTRGCLAWTMTLTDRGKSYKGFVECSLNGQFVQTLDQYPGILDDFRATYKKARTMSAELWVSSHASFFGMPEKYAKLQTRGPNDPNPFVDPQGYLAHVDQFEKSFEDALARPAQGKGGAGKGKGKQ